MKYVYYVNGDQFTTDNYKEIPRDNISSPDEQTPAFENLETGLKLWFNKGYILNRLTGPAVINSNGTKEFWLNDEYYHNIQEWLILHPNQNNAFHVEMLERWG
jgi:hypothetical protein